jgi:hypothetical protein
VSDSVCGTFLHGDSVLDAWSTDFIAGKAVPFST